MKTYNLKFILLYFLFLTFLSCSKIKPEKIIYMNWENLTNSLPSGIFLYKGENKNIPLKAWYVKINLNLKNISTKILLSKEVDKNESPMKMMLDNDSEILINGGYFINSNNPMRHVGLLKTKGNLNEPASRSVIKDSIRYYINRGAFGIKKDGLVDIAWCSTKNDSIFEWDSPLSNRPGSPDSILNFRRSKHWDVIEALHAGPVLINDGKIYVSVEEEVFFNTPVAGVQPRSAIGYTKNDELIMIVVDGRQVKSRGVYLEELAIMMHDLGCIEALNLDGGGSSALLVQNKLINRPLGSGSIRKIMSAISISVDKKL